MQQNTSIRSAARQLLQAGISFVPIDHGTKRPFASMLPEGQWKPYQERRPNETEINYWFGQARALAVICGRVSGGLLIFDFDVPGFYERWVGAVGALIPNAPTQQTGGGGQQVLIRCDDPGGNQKLAWAPADNQSGRTIAIETRGEGGYAVIPPSLHPSGNHYQWIQGDLRHIPHLDQAQVGILCDAARSLDERPYTRQQMARQAEREQQASQQAQARQVHYEQSGAEPRPIEVYNRRFNIADILRQHGYTQRGNRMCRPGGKSDSVVLLDGNISCHHSTSDPMAHVQEARGCVTPFDAHMVLGLQLDPTDPRDVQEGVRAIVEALGLRRPPPPRRPQPTPRQQAPEAAPQDATPDEGQAALWSPDLTFEVQLNATDSYTFGRRCYLRTERRRNGEFEPVNIPIARDVWPMQRYRSEEDGEHGYRFLYLDAHGEQHYALLPAGAAVGKNAGRKACEALADQGVQVATESEFRLAFSLGHWAGRMDPPPPLVTLVRTSGWHGDEVYVNGDQIFGAPGWYVDEQSIGIANRTGRGGTLEGWLAGLEKLVTTHGTRFALGQALAGALIEPLHLHPFALHLWVDSTQGKSTAAYLASALWGFPDQTFKTWNLTAQSPEALAEQMNGACLVLDEIAQYEHDTQKLAQTIHALCSPIGRSSLGQGRKLNEQRRWRCTILSTGEISGRARLGEYYQGGHRVRFLDLHCQPGDLARDQRHAEALKGFCYEQFGLAGDAWIAYLLQPNVLGNIKTEHGFWQKKALEHVVSKGPEEGRICAQLALVATALSHAHKAGITPWGVEEVHEALTWAIDAVLDDEREDVAEERPATPNERAYRLFMNWQMSQPYRFPESTKTDNARDVVGFRVTDYTESIQSGRTITGCTIHTSEGLLSGSGLPEKTGISPRGWAQWCVDRGLATRSKKKTTLPGGQRARWISFDLSDRDEDEPPTPEGSAHSESRSGHEKPP